MVTVGIYLKDPKAVKSTPIYLLVNPGKGSTPIRVYGGESIWPSQWVAGKMQRARTRGKELVVNAGVLNTKLERMAKLLVT